MHVGDKFSEVDRAHTVCAVLQLLCQRRLLSFCCLCLCVPCFCCWFENEREERKIEAVVAVILDAVDRG